MKGGNTANHPWQKMTTLPSFIRIVLDGVMKSFIQSRLKHSRSPLLPWEIISQLTAPVSIFNDRWSFPHFSWFFSQNKVPFSTVISKGHGQDTEVILYHLTSLPGEGKRDLCFRGEGVPPDQKNHGGGVHLVSFIVPGFVVSIFT